MWPAHSALFGEPAQSFCSAELVQCKGFHQGNLYQTSGKTVNKMTRSTLTEEIRWSWFYNHSVLNFEGKPSPASEVV